ncbi:MAG: hypothetical protein GY803_26335, partial [Chloroflexi bacterium]|nr:hypothetical protein [Chloroflexota bacterium]
IPENTPFDLHDCKRRARLMARQNIKAQYQRVDGDDSPVFLGLEPPADGPAVFTGAGCVDPIYVATVGVGLAQKVNLGDYNNIVPAYTDWADVRTVAHNAQSDLHIAISRLWDGLWTNMRDEIARAQGGGSIEDNFGLPSMEVEDLTGEAEGRVGKSYEAENVHLPITGNGRNHRHHNGNGRP